MTDTLLTMTSWLAVLAITVSAVLFGQGARAPTRRPSEPGAARARRIGTALSISGPIAVLLLALAVAAMTESWLLVAILAFAAVALVSLAGLVLAPH
ncbi:MAG: hypothetical protein H0U22_08675 [Geodermatophilaceae bacterium]|jgi:hypothetical protein|nr:hypothetical protein [Geodermatophilaceae bacterium]